MIDTIVWEMGGENERTKATKSGQEADIICSGVLCFRAGQRVIGRDWVIDYLNNNTGVNNNCEHNFVIIFGSRVCV